MFHVLFDAFKLSNHPYGRIAKDVCSRRETSHAKESPSSDEDGPSTCDSCWSCLFVGVTGRCPSSLLGLLPVLPYCGCDVECGAACGAFFAPFLHAVGELRQVFAETDIYVRYKAPERSLGLCHGPCRSKAALLLVGLSEERSDKPYKRRRGRRRRASLFPTIVKGSSWLLSQSAGGSGFWGVVFQPSTVGDGRQLHPPSRVQLSS